MILMIKKQTLIQVMVNNVPSVFVIKVIHLFLEAVTDEKLGKRKPKGNRKNRENPKKDAQEAGNNLRKYHLYKTYINSCI
jgi:hypothetical protein